MKLTPGLRQTARPVQRLAQSLNLRLACLSLLSGFRDVDVLPLGSGVLRYASESCPQQRLPPSGPFDSWAHIICASRTYLNASSTENSYQRRQCTCTTRVHPNSRHGKYHSYMYGTCLSILHAPVSYMPHYLTCPYIIDHKSRAFTGPGIQFYHALPSCRTRVIF
ncbi:hypothetical protein BGX38DRAFT_759806 [Terfezia claveryi]|nr:hypothetical protein BGX38DRAFT_759806 [Terfezia claveryi]